MNDIKALKALKNKILSLAMQGTLLKQNENLTGIRFSMANYREQEKMVNVPLALVEEYFKTLKNEKIKI